jgi:type IV fimbrial biogenesis protein FimT
MDLIQNTSMAAGRFSPRHRVLGYTMLELLVTVAIVGLLAALAVPSFQDTIERNGRESAMLDLVGSLGFARSEAVTQGRSVSICRSADQATCAATEGGDWTIGWLVFTDGGTLGDVDGEDAVLQVNSELPQATVITLNNDDDTDITNDFLRFTTDGFLDIEDISSQVYFKLCAFDADSSKSRAIWIAPTGRSTMSVADADDIHDDVLGADLVCP